MTIYSFISAPHQGHMNHVKKIYVYLYKISNTRIQVQTEDPDYLEFQYHKFNWDYPGYIYFGNLLLYDTPIPMV